MGRFLVSFTGLADAGPVSIDGLQVGDRVLELIAYTGSDETPNFATVVVVANELLQNQAGFDSITLYALIERAVLIQ